MSSPLDPTHLIDTPGSVGVAAILFAECGPLVVLGVVAGSPVPVLVEALRSRRTRTPA